jgi:hypothetical protein
MDSLQRLVSNDKTGIYSGAVDLRERPPTDLR